MRERNLCSLSFYFHAHTFSEIGIRDFMVTVFMADCATLESGLSHWVPEFIGSLISTLLIAIGIFLFEWRRVKKQKMLDI